MVESPETSARGQLNRALTGPRWWWSQSAAANGFGMAAPVNLRFFMTDRAKHIAVCVVQFSSYF